MTWSACTASTRISNSAAGRRPRLDRSTPNSVTSATIRTTALDLTLVQESDDAFSVRYAQGIKAATFRDRGHRSGREPENHRRLQPPASRQNANNAWMKSTRACPPGANAIHDYPAPPPALGVAPAWRWYMRRVWVPMKPSARRIVWLLYLITVVEFSFFRGLIRGSNIWL